VPVRKRARQSRSQKENRVKHELVNALARTRSGSRAQNGDQLREMGLL